MFGDTFTLWSEGRAWLDGQYIGLYPLPFVMLWSLLARIRVEVVVVGVLIASVVLCVVMFKREVLLWIFYLPILETLAIGQLSLAWLFLLKAATPLSLALLTLKPHLFLLALPVLVQRREMWRPFALWGLILYLPVTIMRPTWLSEWIGNILGDTRITGGTSASLWALPFMVGGAWLGYLALSRRLNWQTLCTSFNPAIRPYDYTLLAGGSRWLIPVSWLAGVVMIAVQAAWPMALLGIAAALLPVSMASNHAHLTRAQSYDNLTA